MYHFIVNPVAKGGKLKKEWSRLKALIDDSFLEYKVHFTSYKGHGTEIVKQLTNTQEPISIIAVGGDGTMNEVVNGIVNHHFINFGYVPYGSGMDFARGHNIPLDPKKALEIIKRGHTKSIKYSKVIGDKQIVRSFASNCGIGFDAEVSSEANIEKTYMKRLFNKMNLGTLTYVYFVLKKLLTFNRIQFDIILNQEAYHYENSWFVTFCNHPYVGGGMKMNPLANPEEKKLDATIAFGLNRGQVLKIFPTIFKGTHINHHGVELLHGKDYQVKASRPVEAHVDGEVIGKFINFAISLHEERLRIYA